MYVAKSCNVSFILYGHVSFICMDV
jgi:hypothetical protein